MYESVSLKIQQGMASSSLDNTMLKSAGGKDWKLLQLVQWSVQSKT